MSFFISVSLKYNKHLEVEGNIIVLMTFLLIFLLSRDLTRVVAILFLRYQDWHVPAGARTRASRVGSEHSRKEPSRQLNLQAIRNLYSWEEVILHTTLFILYAESCKMTTCNVVVVLLKKHLQQICCRLLRILVRLFVLEKYYLNVGKKHIHFIMCWSFKIPKLHNLKISMTAVLCFKLRKSHLYSLLLLLHKKFFFVMQINRGMLLGRFCLASISLQRFSLQGMYDLKYALPVEGTTILTPWPSQVVDGCKI